MLVEQQHCCKTANRKQPRNEADSLFIVDYLSLMLVGETQRHSDPPTVSIAVQGIVLGW